MDNASRWVTNVVAAAGRRETGDEGPTTDRLLPPQPLTRGVNNNAAMAGAGGGAANNGGGWNQPPTVAAIADTLWTM